MSLNSQSIAALIYLILYLGLFTALSILYALRNVIWRSRYTVLWIHMIIRITSQCCGLAFGTLGWQHWQLLIAYLILSAEGYFSLVLCAYRFLIAWQEHVLGQSFLEPKNVRALALRQRFSLRNATQMVLVHYALIGANTIIIVGGSLMSDFQTTVNWRTDPTVFTGKVLRTVGQAISSY